MQIAVVHDGTAHPGGAVQVVLEGAREFDADLYVGFSGKDEDWWIERAPEDVTVLRNATRLGTLNNLRTVRTLMKLDIREYDVVLTSGPAAKFFQPYDDQLQIHYIHHPPLSSLWFDGGLFDYLVKTIDRVETLSVPHLVANSDLTARRVHRHYNREVDRIIAPPVDVESFTLDRERIENQIAFVGRLEERKRPSVAVAAMRDLPEFTLKVLGEGPLRKTLETEAPKNVEFLGYVSEAKLRRTVEESVAGLFLAEREDFGITPIEYMAGGTPVVGVDEPNTNNQVDRDTGVLVQPTPESVVDGIRQAVNQTWNHEDIRSSAEPYGKRRFRAELREFVETVYF